MGYQREIDPGHNERRALLRLIGPAVAGVGLVLTAIGVISFFSAFGGGGPPRFFWCAFLGLPMLGIGLQITLMAFVGSVARYHAAEMAPVARDTFNDLAEGTSEGVRTMARSASQGFREGMDSSRGPTGHVCPSCRGRNEAGSKYCTHCGAGLVRDCPSCAEPNGAEARFCGQCGATLA